MICRHRERHGVTWQGISSVGSEQTNLNFLFWSIKFILWCPKELFNTFVCVCVCVFMTYIFGKKNMETLICLTSVVGALFWNYIIFQNWLHRWQTFQYTMGGISGGQQKEESRTPHQEASVLRRSELHLMKRVEVVLEGSVLWGFWCFTPCIRSQFAYSLDVLLWAGSLTCLCFIHKIQSHCNTS